MSDIQDLSEFHYPDTAPPVTWKCEACKMGKRWARIVERGGLQKMPKLGEPVTDRGPIQVEIGERTFDACSRECARDIWMVKSFEEITRRVIALTPPSPA